MAQPILRTRGHRAGSPARRRQALSVCDRSRVLARAVASLAPQPRTAGWAAARRPMMRVAAVPLGGAVLLLVSLVLPRAQPQQSPRADHLLLIGVDGLGSD